VLFLDNHRKRVARPVASLVALIATGCVVPQSQYDEVVEVNRQEQVAHGETHRKLYQKERELDALRKSLDERRNTLVSKEFDLEAAKLRIEQALQEREEAGQLAEQLRGELSRIAEHLRVLGAEREALRLAAESAEERVAELTAIVRVRDQNARIVYGLTRALDPQIDDGTMTVDLQSGTLSVRFASSTVFAEDGSLKEDAAGWLRSVAGASIGQEVRLFVSEVPATDASLGRLSAVAGELERGGISTEHIALSASKADSESGERGERGESGESGEPAEAAQLLVVRFQSQPTS
jgi:hypothetical protein